MPTLLKLFINFWCGLFFLFIGGYFVVGVYMVFQPGNHSHKAVAEKSAHPESFYTFDSVVRGK